MPLQHHRLMILISLGRFFYYDHITKFILIMLQVPLHGKLHQIIADLPGISRTMGYLTYFLKKEKNILWL